MDRPSSTPDTADDSYNPSQSANAFDKVVGAISLFSGRLAGLAVVLILVLVCTEVILRRFKLSLLVADEIAGYLNAGIVFLGLAYTLREGGFIRVELIYDALRGRMKQAVRWLIVLTSTIFVGALAYYSYLHVDYAYRSDTRAVSVINTPEWIPQAFMFLGFVVLLLQLLAFISNRVRNIP